jgi:hypothetical protein
MAALVLLTAMPASATARGSSANAYADLTVIHGGTLGFVPGQTVHVTVPGRLLLQDGSVRLVSHKIKVYVCPADPPAGAVGESTLVYSGESGGLNEAGHVFTIGRGDLSVPGEPGTGRVQLWIEVETFLISATPKRAEDNSANVLRPIFELMDDASGRTVVVGLLLPAVRQIEVSGKTAPPLARSEVVSFDAFEPGFRGGVSVGAAAGQSVRIMILAADASQASLQPSGEPDVIVGAGSGAGGHVRVIDARTGATLQIQHLINVPSEPLIDINRDELAAAGAPGTGRIQLWIEVVVPRHAGRGQAGGPQVKVFNATFEVIDNPSGRTTVRGGIWKTSNFLTDGATIRFTGLE